MEKPELMQEAGILSSLRHSLNTHLQDKGYSRDKIRDTLGWSSVDVQMIYTHSDMMDHSGQAELMESILA